MFIWLAFIASAAFAVFEHRELTKKIRASTGRHKQLARCKLVLLWLLPILMLIGAAASQWGADKADREIASLQSDLKKSKAILEETKNLATRPEYKSLKPELRDQILRGLKEMRKSVAGQKMVFFVGFEKGNLGRARLAEELSGLFKDAELETKYEGAGIYGPESFDTPVRVFMNLNGPGERIYRSMEQPLSRFFTSGIVPLGNPSTSTNEMHFQIMGTPAFLPDGSVIFE